MPSPASTLATWSKTWGKVVLLGSLLTTACGPTEKPAQAPTVKVAPPVPGPDLTALADSNVAALLTPYLKQYPGSEVLIRTRLGTMRLRLYDDTPIHKANFLLLIRKGVFDKTVFNRVVQGLVIQAGRAENAVRLSRYHLPAEIRPTHIHKHGALGMARYDDEQNPHRLSSNNDFYIVQGQKYAPNQAEALAGRKLPPEQIRTYQTIGGLPGLDRKYTVFGEVVEGLDVIDKIAAEPVDPYKWPKKDVVLDIRVNE